MTASKPLPASPSLESLRKQAKKLARDRALSLRDAQLVLAREYGYAGWQDLTAEVSKRLGQGLDWADGCKTGDATKAHVPAVPAS